MSKLQIGDKIQTGMAILNSLLKAPSNVILNKGYSKTMGLSFDCKASQELSVSRKNFLIKIYSCFVIFMLTLGIDLQGTLASSLFNQYIITPHFVTSFYTQNTHH